MAALTGSRDTPRRGDSAAIDLIDFPLAASSQVYKGGIVAFDTSAGGFGKKGATSATLKVAGIATEDALGNASNGGVVTTARRGTFKFGNSTSTDQITQADVFSTCYLVDDQTVAKTSNSNARSIAGRVMAIDADGGVWVELGFL